MAGFAETKTRRAAVIGLGATGIAAVKNLLEAGFDVQGFDQNDYVGGLWHWSSNPQLTTVIKSTKANIAKQRNCYHDFPFPSSVPTYPLATDIAKYIEDYAKHFGLYDHLNLGFRIDCLERSKNGDGWTIKATDRDSKMFVEDFDKVVVATGSYNKGFSPAIEGAKDFKGQLTHAQAYKDSQDYAGKRVVVVGLSNTGGDIAVELKDVASEVYVSFRSGMRILQRTGEAEAPVEAKLSRRMTIAGQTFNGILPSVASKVGASVLERRMLKEHPFIKPEWHLLPAGPLANSTPIVNDHILRCFHDDTVKPKVGVKRLIAPRTVEFADGSKVDDVDTVIFATGYQSDFSIIEQSINPTTFPTPEWDAAHHSNGLLYSRLYYGLFSTIYPDSLAFIGPYRGHSFAIFVNADLSAAGIAQVFAGNYTLPPKAEIEAWCDKNYAKNLESIAKWRIAKIACDPKSLECFLNEAAGNEVNQRLGWGWEGWRFWWQEHALYRKLVDGVDSPFVYRLFKGRGGETGRKQWDGALKAIDDVNEEVRRLSTK